MTAPLPNAIEAEQAVIGALLLRPDAIEQIEGLLRPEECYVPLHQRTLQAALDLHHRELPVDVVTLQNELGGKVSLEQLTDLAGKVFTLENLSAHCQVVADHAVQRRVILLCHEMAAEARDPQGGAEALVSRLITLASECYRDRLNIVTLSSLAAEFIGQCEHRFSHPEEAKPLGVPTGFEALDCVLVCEGFPRGHVTIVAAETSKGKSALAIACLRHAAQRDHKCLDVTLEDVPAARCGRHLAALSGITNSQVQRRAIEANDWAPFTAAVTDACKWGAHVYHLDVRTPVDELCAAAHRVVQQHEIDLVSIDYFQLIPSGRDFTRRQDHVDYVFDRIEHFAATHRETAVLLVSQMARHEGRPQLRNLYHSARLEQGSHTVLLIWAPEISGNYRCRFVDVAKQKDGPTGLRVLGWEGRCVRFFDADEVEAERYMKEVSALT